MLGLIGFGGPITHIAWFRQEFVERRGWLDGRAFDHLLTLCQFLPGPSSSQMGFCLGLLRAGWRGALAAFLAFTLPSALAMYALARASTVLADSPALGAVVHGLKLAALVVVAQALIGMFRSLCPDTPRRAIAVASAALLLATGPWAQAPLIAASALAGWFACRGAPMPARIEVAPPYGARVGVLLVAACGALLIALVVLARTVGGPFVFLEAFYRTGALSFGGGHVVLPLLEETVLAPGWMSSSDFLAGYGAAQALPGPLFAISAFLGARLPPPWGGIGGACMALGAIFLPGFLLVAGALPLWNRLQAHRGVVRAVAGVGAAVVGMLAAALVRPLGPAALLHAQDVLAALVGLALLQRWPRAGALILVFCVASALAVA